MRETSRDESQNVLSTQKLFKTRDLELPNLEGNLSQVVRRTPQDTPVPLYTRTSPFGIDCTSVALHTSFSGASTTTPFCFQVPDHITVVNKDITYPDNPYPLN